jgi:hypothetical protein
MTKPTQAAVPAPGNQDRWPWGVVAGSLTLLLLPLLGVVFGWRTLFFRDVSNLHLPAKWAQALSWSRGELPVLDLLRAGGQPSLGNPNLLPLYPDNLLYLLGAKLWAFNAHYWLHLLIAPLAAAWLGRELGLRRRAAWAMGVFYATSGYFFSQLNFYNLVAVNALLPAFLAAFLAAARSESLRDRARLALVFGTLLLAGDPMLALLGVAVAGALLLFGRRTGSPEGAGWIGKRVAWLVGALGMGALLGLPQHVEFLRTLPESYRAYIGYSASGSLVGSWDPRQVVEWLVPFAFGHPDQTFWGGEFFGGVQPFFFSLYPGVLLLGCLLAGGRPRGRLQVGAWIAIVVGIFVACGAHNPAIVWLAALSSEWFGSLLRFPIKFWWLVALAAAYLGALGLERLALAGRRPAVIVFGSFAALHLVLLAALRSQLLHTSLIQVVPEVFAPDKAAEVLVQWRTSLVWATSAALILLVVSLLRHRMSNEHWYGGVLLVHVAVQVVVLAPLRPTDTARAYAEPSPLLQAVAEGNLGASAEGENFATAPSLVQGTQFGAFGPSSPAVRYPDSRAFWIQRRGATELYPFAGVRWGLHYENNVSADGLDHFASHLSLSALRTLTDAERLRLLQAWGVDWLVLDRRLRGVEESVARRKASIRQFEVEASLYEIQGQAPAALVTGSVFPAENVGEARARMLDPEFDPRRDVVVLHDLSVAGERGTVLSYSEEPGTRAAVTLEVQTRGPSVLMLSRAYQPHYRARVDGEPAQTVLANLSRLGIVVPGGAHRVEVELDLGHLEICFLVASLSWLSCLVVVGRRRAAGQTAGASGRITSQLPSN